MDIAFQGQKGEWLFLITIVCIDTTRKKQRAVSMVGGSGKKKWQAWVWKKHPHVLPEMGFVHRIGSRLC